MFLVVAETIWKEEKKKTIDYRAMCIFWYVSLVVVFACNRVFYVSF